MFVVDLIAKKRLGKKLLNDEIKFLVNGYANGEIPDYQISALLMAIMFQSLNDEETIAFTKAFVDSGNVIDLSPIPGIKIDKHSTGGIGDKVTLIVGPIMAALNINFAKMSGPGLSYTGGTIDKLMSIKGFNVDLSIKEFITQVKKIKLSVIAQTEDIVPADKKFYALRDVTDTVASIPLITISIMSKKIATGANALLLDVKCGSGAFMKNLKDAQLLAQKMINIGKGLKKDVKVEITSMDEPLGQTIGNRIEVLEAIHILQGKGANDLRSLIISSCVTMLKQANNMTTEMAKKNVEDVIDNGQALAKFKEWIAYQGGDVDHLFSDNFWKPLHQKSIYAANDGFLIITSAIDFGICSVKLGAGREVKGAKIDFDAGIYLHHKTGDTIKKDALLFTLYSSKPIKQSHIKIINQSFSINQNRKSHPIILKQMG